ncbi:hypothetical protein [Candidatus Lokiarchaeum ossiferum]
MSYNNAPSNTKFKRHPAKRTFIGDLIEGQWNDEEKILSTRYGNLKRVRLCGTLINKKEVVEQNSEDSFLAESFESNSRLSFQIDDGTGQLWGTIWGIEQNEYDHLLKGDLIDFVGIVRFYKSNVAVTAEFVRKIKDPNNLIYHNLEVLRKRKLDQSFEISKSPQNDFTDFDFNPTEEKTIPNIQEFESQSPPPMKINPVRDQVITKSNESAVFDNLDQNDQIVDYILKQDSGDGVSIKQIAEHFSIEINHLQSILEQLSQDVRIYKSQPGHYSSY